MKGQQTEFIRFRLCTPPVHAHSSGCAAGRWCVNLQPEQPPFTTQRGTQLLLNAESGTLSGRELLVDWTWHSGVSTGHRVDTSETDYPEKQLFLSLGEKSFLGERKHAKPCLLHEMISPEGRKVRVLWAPSSCSLVRRKRWEGRWKGCWGPPTPALPSLIPESPPRRPTSLQGCTSQWALKQSLKGWQSYLTDTHLYSSQEGIILHSHG